MYSPTDSHLISNSTLEYQRYDYQHQQQYNNRIGNDDEIQYELQHWQFSNNFDFIISAFGFYVALIGIRATNEHTARLAQQYTIGTILVGIAWMIFNYWFTVHLDKEIDQHHWNEIHNHTNSTTNHTTTTTMAPTPNYFNNDNDDDDELPTDWEYYQANLSIMMIPGMVWILCCIRAYQFQSLLEEAEREAEERIRSELAQHNLDNNGTNNNATSNNDVESPPSRTSSDLELQVSSTSSSGAVFT